MSSFDIDVTRDGGWWMVHIPNGASPQPDEACLWSPVAWGLRPVGVRP